jgi:hypothetical protein
MKLGHVFALVLFIGSKIDASSSAHVDTRQLFG